MTAKQTRTMNSKPQTQGGTPLDAVIDLFMMITEWLVNRGIDLTERFLRWAFNGQSANRQKIGTKEIKSNRTTEYVDHLGWCVNHKRPFLLSELDMRRHSLIVGASGWGKTNLLRLLMENDLQNKRPLLFIDPKGGYEAIQSFKTLCATYGRKLYIFSEFDSDETRFNPFRTMSASLVVETIMRAFEWSNEYYEAKCDEALLEAVLAIQKREKGIVSLHSILDELKRRDDSKDISAITAKLTKIAMSEFGERFKDTDGSAITLQDIRKEGACFYVSTPTQGHDRIAKAIAKMFFSELMHHSYKVSLLTPFAAKHLSPISVYVDEAGSVLTQGYIDLLNKCRSSGIQMTVAVQGIADIDAISETLTRQVIENSSNLFIQKQSSHADGEILSSAIGTFETVKKTDQTEDGENTGRASQRETREFHVHPDTLKSLKIGQSILVTHSPKNVYLLNLRNAERPPVTESTFDERKKTYIKFLGMAKS